MAAKVPNFDLDGLSTDEAAMLGEVLKVDTLEEMQAMFAEIKPGKTPIVLMKPLLWLARRQVDPAFTFEQAGAMPLVQLVALVEAGTPKKARAATRKK